MNIEGIYSDETSEYRNPFEVAKNSKVNIFIRAYRGDNVKVFFVSEDEKLRQEMQYSNTRGLFDYYVVSVSVEDETIRYHFEIHSDDGIYYYDKVGLWRDVRHHYAFSIIPEFSVPKWSIGAVMYQILVDRFNNGNPDNDVKTGEYFYVRNQVEHVDKWDSLPAAFDIGRFYGGDLQGVQDKFNYLKSIGVEAIYFNPLFVSPSNHKYDISDYDHIDPHFTVFVNDDGECLQPQDTNNRNATKYKRRVTNMQNLDASNDFFAKFVAQAHECGIKVIIDGVFNHCGSFNKWLNREGIYSVDEGYAPGAYESLSSPYHSYFKFGNLDNWPNSSYEGWWGFDTLPKLNYEDSQALHDYIIQIGKKWVSPPYNVDGWRLDVAADLGHGEEYNHKFWRDFRDAVKEANPNAIILAEHYGNASSWLSGDQWDTVMNYDAFMEPLSYFLTGMEKHSDEYQPNAIGDGERFKNTMLHFMSYMSTPSVYCAMNQLSNHDHSRFLTRTNRTIGRVATKGSKGAEAGISIPVMKLATIIQMTWPGAPTIYYGDEAGVCGWTDPDNRRTYPWGHENEELLGFYRDIVFIHKSSEAIKYGSLRFLNCGNGYISYARFTANEQIIVVINVSDNVQKINIPTWIADIMDTEEIRQIFVCGKRGHSMLPKKFNSSSGNFSCEIEGQSGMIFKCEKIKK